MPGRYALLAGLRQTAAENLRRHIPEFPALMCCTQFHFTDEISR